MMICRTDISKPVAGFATLSSVLILLVLSSIVAAQKPTLLYKDKSVPVEKRIDDLLKRMTLEEKILQTNQWTYGKNANPNNIEASKKRFVLKSAL
jgi:beta-glucosidase